MWSFLFTIWQNIPFIMQCLPDKFYFIARWTTSKVILASFSTKTFSQAIYEKTAGGHCLLCTLVLFCLRNILVRLYLWAGFFENLKWTFLRTLYAYFDEPEHDKTNKVISVHLAKTQISLSVRPVWSVFAVRIIRSLATHRVHSKDWSDRADAQAGQSFRWSYKSFCFVFFCHVRLTCKFLLWEIPVSSYTTLQHHKCKL